MDSQAIQQILTDAADLLRTECDEINAEFLLLFYPYPKQLVAPLSTEHRDQVGKRVTAACQQYFHEAVREAIRDQARSN